VHSVRAESAAQLESSLRAALAADKPALIEVPVGKMERRY
jgi:thiamine pyrophosphate-dependent acetolactate synthase large subunit-like protein